MIKAVSFDLEGTLIDVESAHHRGHILAANDAGVKLTIEEALRVLPHFIGGPDEAVAKEISELAGKLDDDYILNRMRFHYNQLIETIPIGLRPGALEIISWLKENGFNVAIGSLTIAVQAQLLLERSGLIKIFGRECIVLREEVRHVKPEPDVWLETARRSGIDPKEQLVFDDSHNGIIAAVAAGSVAVAMPVYNTPLTIKRLIDAGALRIFIDWREMNIAALIENLNKE